MVAFTREIDSYLQEADSPEVEKVSSKQLKRIEEQHDRKAKKMAKRQAKAGQKERNAIERELKQDERERKAEHEQVMNQGLSGKEMEEQKRQKEEDILFQEYLKEEPKKTVNHTKKSAFDSNRLGLNMA
mmetsp:Transcript_43751/g.44425  ORF Transcript_43751/g.44425 Transcript_43751/m.44425 type:complete len:129 (-) Transcript_43751:228-614(-)